MWFFIQVLRFIGLGLLGIGVEAIWRAFMRSKPLHVLAQRIIGDRMPYDELTMKRNVRHWTQRRELIAHVPLGMFWVYAPGLSFGFDLINRMVGSVRFELWNIVLHALLFPLCFWVVELFVGSIITKKKNDKTVPKWWDYSDDGYWIIHGKRYIVHFQGKVRWDYAPAWVFMGFFMEFLRLALDPAFPVIANRFVHLALALVHIFI